MKPFRSTLASAVADAVRGAWEALAGLLGPTGREPLRIPVRDRPRRHPAARR
jgi:hypothetical protein